MFKERVKTSIIIILLLNCLLLTYQLWFKSGMLGSEDLFHFSFSDLPFVRIFSQGDNVSIPKENLSKPRKIVINDGDLWIPYYNTDEAFDNLDEQTSKIIKSLLSKDDYNYKKISYESWREHLMEESVYVEYPIAVNPRMLAAVLNTDYERIPSDISVIKDAIIIPRGEEGVSVAIRDAETNKAVEFYINDDELAFPVEVLGMYADKFSGDGYYEFAYSALMGQMSLGEGSVKMGELVLFSDNDASVDDIRSINPMETREHKDILESFGFSPKPLRHYPDNFGAENYVENYATVRIFSDGYIEYSAVEGERGLELDTDSENTYELLNSAIDFAEKVWKGISDKELNVLVSGIEETQTGSKFTFDYYFGGREIAVGIEKEGRESLYHAIEIELEGDRIVSYRQYLREYEDAGTYTKQEHFNSALDYYVELFESFGDCTITDMYPGYFDGGNGTGILKTTWLGELDESEERYPKK